MVRQDCDIKEIDEILDEAIMNAKPHYLIKWKNQPHQFDTWQPIENLIHITTDLTDWIKQRRRYHSSNHNHFGTSSYQLPSRQRKRKNIKKRQHRPRHVPSNQVIVLDEEVQDCSSQNFKIKNRGPHQDQKKKLQQNFHQQVKDTKNVGQISSLPQNNGISSEIPIKTSEGMKIVGRVKKQDVKQIDKVFMWKGHKCFKIKLSTGKLTNMRQEDLKLLCPEMLCDFYENNQIEF